METQKVIIDPHLYQIIGLTFGVILSVLGIILQYNFLRIVKRQDSFSASKDDHEQRLTRLETGFTGFLTADVKRDHEVNKTFDRIEGSIDEVRLDLKKLTQTLYEYLIDTKQKQHGK